MRILLLVLMLGNLGLSGCTGCVGMVLDGCKLKPVSPVPGSDLPGGREAKQWPPRAEIPLSSTRAKVDSIAADSAREEMRDALRALALAQAHLYREEQLYSGDPSRLVAAFGLVVPEGVYLRVVSAGRDGWSARAEHIRLPARTCVLWFGREGYPASITTAFENRRGEVQPGIPVCDGDPIFDSVDQDLLAARGQRLLLTLDRDFGELIYPRGADAPPAVVTGTTSGVVQLPASCGISGGVEHGISEHPGREPSALLKVMASRPCRHT
jgi:hypothetical protein